MNDITILVNSCDAYSDLWLPFFTLLKKYWPGEIPPIILNTETKNFSFPGLDIQKAVLTETDCEAWGKRFKASLKQIPTKYVLIFLEDFWLEKTVDIAGLNACVAAMEQDKSIKSFSFVPTLWDNIKDGQYENFELRKRMGHFLVNLQVGLWRTSELYDLALDNETPWQFGTNATYRASKGVRKGDKYYAAIDGCPQVFTYNWKPGGAVHRGRWTDGVDTILSSINITMDYSIRGWDRDVPVPTNSHKSLRKRISDFIWPFVEWFKYYR